VDGRITHAPTPEGRIAAVIRSQILQDAHPIPDRPDYADLNDWLRPFLSREFLLERIEEAQGEARRKFLQEDLDRAEARIEKKFLDGATPGARIARAAYSLIVHYTLPVPQHPTEKDLAAGLAIYLDREFLFVRLDESRRDGQSERQMHLREELLRSEKRIAENLL
jgi:hypothetical protein